ncbi:methyltransferase domain-containing protein [Thermodesulfobacterium sp. TA1]|uniref:class I SAM-dependent methyltransferase n=1 Tax=Thermodesulfobacterium sp. TA1 TaxID=2234087 RepID=UPI001232B27A|nr:methyltransferase [Thermodesulfobacterium sp. TA1]QER41205.1 methyltransferase domain-containing protein [Thermodesulfobacterium sp. TA1]
MNFDKLTLENELITVKDKSFKIVRPAKLEEIFEGDPFLEVEKFPLWFKVWEASLVLADYVAGLTSPKKILELGAGLGVVSLVAAGFGHEVLATDYDKQPLKFLELSAKENGLSLKTQVLDWTSPNLQGKFELIVGAEIVFRKSLFDPLLEIFKNFLTDQGEVLLAHSGDRKRVLVPFLYKAQEHFEVLTSIRKIKGEDGTQEIILNKLLFKKN